MSKVFNPGILPRLGFLEYANPDSEIIINKGSRNR